MNRYVQVPAKGQPMTAQWGADVANGLNAIRSAGQSGMLLADGPTGTGFAPLPANLRDRRGGSSVQPRQFDIRARIEARGEDDTKEYRLVVEFYHCTDDAVSLSGKAVDYFGELQTLSNGWNNIYTSSWSSNIAESKQYYLNVWIGVELEEDGTWTRFSENDTRWWISDKQTSHVHSTGATLALFKHGYLLGSVVAGNSSASVTQKFDGPLIFLDLVKPGILGGGGGSGSDVDGTNYPMPFQYKRTDTEDQETGELTSSFAIVNNNFYWDGELKSVTPDPFTPPATCTVYLCCTQAEPSSSGEAEWKFSIATSPAQAPSGGRAVNYKLYDIADNKVTMDYRTTFMELNSPHKVAMFSVEKYDNDVHSSVLLDASTPNVAEVRVRDGNGNEVSLTSGEKSANLTVLNKDRKSVVIDPVDLEGGSVLAKFSKLTVHHVDGTYDTYYVLADNDIEITEASGEVLKDIDIEYSGYQLTFTKTFIDLETQEERTDGPNEVFTAVPHSSM